MNVSAHKIQDLATHLFNVKAKFVMRAKEMLKVRNKKNNKVSFHNFAIEIPYNKRNSWGLFQMLDSQYFHFAAQFTFSFTTYDVAEESQIVF